MARHVLKFEIEEVYTEPSITALQAFTWKIKAPQKMCHLILQLITGHVAVMRNLTRRHMRCDTIPLDLGIQMSQ